MAYPESDEKTNVFAKTTIILSYPFVYCFKPICYGMIVAILNYHSSIITIMVKDDNVLCINYTIKNRDRSGTGAKPVKTASFFIKTGFSFVKNGLDNRLRPGCTHHRDPGAGEVQTRVCAKPFRECREVYPLYQGTFMPSFCILSSEKRHFFSKKRPRFVNGYSAYININSALSSI